MWRERSLNYAKCIRYIVFELSQNESWRLKSLPPSLQGIALPLVFGICHTLAPWKLNPRTLENKHTVCLPSDLLQQEFSALPLGGEAGDGPHFDLDARVELLVPHVPDSLDRCGYCFVLQEKRQAGLVTDVTL